MKVISPLELPDLDLSGLKDGRRVNALQGMPLLWADRDSFGGWLKAQRKTARLSVRATASKLNISHSLIIRMETGERVGPPPLTLLDDLADIYRCDVRKMLHEAGYRLEVPEDMVLDAEGQIKAQFEALVFHPSLAPSEIRSEAMAYIPLLIKRQWVEFTQNLVRQPKPETLVNDILDKADADFKKQKREEEQA